ncbi:hypothetical protein FF1_043391 [Malus domestica]
MDPNIILRELKKRFKNKIREVEMETGSQDLDLTRLLASAMNLNLFYMWVQLLILRGFISKFIVNFKLMLTIDLLLSVQVLVMIYKKGFAYDNTKPKYDRTLYDLKKLKRQLRRIKAALHGMNLEAGEDEDEDEKFATLQKWKHAGRENNLDGTPTIWLHGSLGCSCRGLPLAGLQWNPGRIGSLRDWCWQGRSCKVPCFINVRFIPNRHSVLSSSDSVEASVSMIKVMAAKQRWGKSDDRLGAED